jgi:hypothetical protein
LLWDSFCPGPALDYFHRGWAGESHVVCDAQLFILQFHTRCFAVGWRGPLFFSAEWHGEAFHGLGIQDVAEFDSDRCSVFCLLEEKRKIEKKNKKREMTKVFFPRTRHALLAVVCGIFTADMCN